MILPIISARDESGFTLLELSISLLLLCLLLGFAIPSFHAWQKKSYREVLTQDLVSAIELAKSEAIKQNKRVLLCASDNGLKCSTNWSRVLFYLLLMVIHLNLNRVRISFEYGLKLKMGL